MTLTLGVKNLFGCVVGLDKPRWHLKAGTDEAYFGRMLAELAIAVDAELTILDAVVGMDGNGPGGGRQRDFGFLALSANPFALDVAVAGLFGVDPRKVPALAAGIELGAAPASPAEIKTLGADPSELRVHDFLPPSAQRIGFNMPAPLFRFLKRLFTPKVRIRHRRCVRCMACVEICPADALHNDGKRVHVDRSVCINCYCCAEVCPHNAVRISRLGARSDRRGD
jgi:ferredoxin